MRIKVPARYSWVTLVLVVISTLAPEARAEIRVVDGHYQLVTLVRDTPFAAANGAAIGDDGALYITHTGDGTTTRIDLRTFTATEFVHPWAGTFAADDLTPDGKGGFFMTGTTPLV